MKNNKKQSKNVRSKNNNNNVVKDSNVNKRKTSNDQNVGFDVESGESFELDKNNDHSFELKDCK